MLLTFILLNNWAKGNKFLLLDKRKMIDALLELLHLIIHPIVIGLGSSSKTPRRMFLKEGVFEVSANSYWGF